MREILVIAFDEMKLHVTDIIKTYKSFLVAGMDSVEFLLEGRTSY